MRSITAPTKKKRLQSHLSEYKLLHLEDHRRKSQVCRQYRTMTINDEIVAEKQTQMMKVPVHPKLEGACHQGHNGSSETLMTVFYQRRNELRFILRPTFQTFIGPLHVTIFSKILTSQYTV